MMCQEYRGAALDLSMWSSMCQMVNGTFSSGVGCATSPIVGRCINRPSGGEVHFIYYSPTWTGSRATLRSMCEQGGGTWQDS